MKNPNVLPLSDGRKRGRPKKSADAEVSVTSAGEPIDQEAAAEFLRTNARNIERKLKSGETLSASQLNFLQAIQGGAGSPTARQFAANQVELAAALGVDRKTIQRAMKMPGHPEARADGRHEIAAWRTFLQGTGAIASDDVDTVKEKARNLVLKNQKLEAENAILRRSWKPVEEIERWGADIGAGVRKTICQLHRIAQSISGLSTPEIEIRLKEKEDEILAQLNGLQDKIQKETA